MNVRINPFVKELIHESNSSDHIPLAFPLHMSEFFSLSFPTVFLGKLSVYISQFNERDC